MDKFTALTAVAVPYDAPNVDTNQLCPTRFNKVAKGPDFYKVLFHDLRFDRSGAENPDFVLNQPAYRKAGIIVGDKNFGCGSSREAAVYALQAFGIRALVAASFGEIFAANLMKNSILPVTLPEETCALIRRQLHAEIGAQIAIDLATQTVHDVAGQPHSFDIHPLRKRCLLEGLDDISLTEQYAADVAAFEATYHAQFDWLVKPENQPRPASR